MRLFRQSRRTTSPSSFPSTLLPLSCSGTFVLLIISILGIAQAETRFEIHQTPNNTPTSSSISYQQNYRHVCSSTFGFPDLDDSTSILRTSPKSYGAAFTHNAPTTQAMLTEPLIEMDGNDHPDYINAEVAATMQSDSSKALGDSGRRDVPGKLLDEINDSTRVTEEDLERLEITWGDLNNYNLSTVLGEGEYSEAFEAIDTRSDRKCVVKILKPVSKTRVKREMKILQDLSGGPNILTLFEIARNNESKQPSLITEYVNNTDHHLLYPTFEDVDVRFYMFQLLRAVEYTHQKNIMHRDIKPYNVMIDHENQKLRLIDWGLSDYYTEGSPFSTHVASRYWRAPELLVEYEWYNPSSDIWAVGCMLAALVFGREPFFRGRHSDVGQLIEISRLLGTQDLFTWLDKYHITLPEEYNNIFGWHKKRSWSSIVSWQYYRRVSDDVLDLLERMLVYDHHERLTATEAMAHPYFDPVREWALSDPNSYTV